MSLFRGRSFLFIQAFKSLTQSSILHSNAVEFGQISLCGLWFIGEGLENLKHKYLKKILTYANNKQATMLWEPERMRDTPSYISIESWHRRVKALISANEGVFLDLPDLTILVPGFQVGLQVSCVSCHTCSYRSLNPTDLFILLCRNRQRK